MEIKIQPTTSTANLDTILAMEIYDTIKTFGNADLAFKNPTTDFDNENIVLVDKDIDKVINQITTALYSSPTTETALKASLTSDYVLTDVIYNDFKDGRTWEVIKEEYTITDI